MALLNKLTQQGSVYTGLNGTTPPIDDQTQSKLHLEYSINGNPNIANKPHSKGDIVTIKLTSDTEIITRFVSQDDTSITIEKPMAVSITPQGLGLMPWLFSADASKEITISNEQVFCTMDTLKDLADQYVEGTTGISLAKA